MRSHAHLIAAADFFTTEVWTARGLVRYFTLFVIDVATRRVHIAGTTESPDSPWMETDCAKFDGLRGGIPCREALPDHRSRRDLLSEVQIDSRGLQRRDSTHCVPNTEYERVRRAVR